MNCDEFNDRLLEFLDESLDAGVQDSAREHLRECGDCRRAVQREQATAESIRHSLERAAANISLRPEARRNILRALESQPAPAYNWLRAWLFSVPVRLIGAGAALTALVLLLRGISLNHRMAERPAPTLAAQSDQNIRTIDVPGQTPTHVFRWENDSVVDMIIPGATVGYAQIPEMKQTTAKRL
jgi:hypothetical protein